MTQHDDQLYVWHMLESAEKARHFAYGKTRADFESDEVLRLALIHLVQTIGEAAQRFARDDGSAPGDSLEDDYRYAASARTRLCGRG